MEHLSPEKKDFLTTFYKNELQRITDEVLDIEETESELQTVPISYTAIWMYENKFEQALKDLAEDFHMVVLRGKKEGYPSIDAWNENN